MKNFKNITVLLIALLSGYISNAQQEPMVSQYMFNSMYLNPACAGKQNYYTAMLLYRQQWVKFDGAPSTQILSVDGGLKDKKTGLGFVMVNDHIGVSNRTDFYANYAYHLQLNKEMKLSFGLRGGLAYYKANLTSLTVWDAGDQVFASNISSKAVPNAGAGMYLYTGNFYAGLSVPNLLSYKPGTFLYIDMNAPQFQRHYYLTAGYMFKAGENVLLKPSFLVKHVASAPVEVDINLNAQIRKLFWLGVSFRSGDSFVGVAEFNVIKNLRIGYAYDHAFTLMRQYAGGSHEIKIAYDFGKNEKEELPSFF